MDAPHLRIAITTNSLISLDANFVVAKQFAFYDVSVDDSEFVDVVQFARGGKGKAQGGGMANNGGRCIMDDMENDDGAGYDPLLDRVAALEGCGILFTLGLSDLAAVRVHDLRVFPVKSERVRPIDDVIAQVQSMMVGVQPLWMRRAISRRNGTQLQEQTAY
ncbi:NifB/NifX family molybdenum-iron cluster-binding protein [Methylocystis heyeri]|uniref:Nitrogen fixation protein n=1 Tax=Methylocystis heyeri TaxID=391905 RepID=A0A6B8KA20_9HYPH|nr:NifB/NifX family molybdenum-iron cluster-binding protein [Methylocystis heyeri]QGM44272.1 nitrogen fixation protein [Methylocystis heyeri]